MACYSIKLFLNLWYFLRVFWGYNEEVSVMRFCGVILGIMLLVFATGCGSQYGTYQRDHSIFNGALEIIEMLYTFKDFDTKTVLTGEVYYTISKPGAYLFKGRVSQIGGADLNVDTWRLDLLSDNIPYEGRRRIDISGSDVYTLQLFYISLEGEFLDDEIKIVSPFSLEYIGGSQASEDIPEEYIPETEPQ
jgi:hypothetical protein